MILYAPSTPFHVFCSSTLISTSHSPLHPIVRFSADPRTMQHALHADANTEINAGVTQVYKERFGWEVLALFDKWVDELAAIKQRIRALDELRRNTIAHEEKVKDLQARVSKSTRRELFVCLLFCCCFCFCLRDCLFLYVYDECNSLIFSHHQYFPYSHYNARFSVHAHTLSLAHSHTHSLAPTHPQTPRCSPRSRRPRRSTPASPPTSSRDAPKCASW